MVRRYRWQSGVWAALFLGLMLFIVGGCQTEPESIDVGFVGTLSGRSSDLGVSVRNGVNIAVDEINSGGGINGRDIELIVEDDENCAEVGAEALRRLHQQDVVAVIGHTFSDISQAVLPVLEEKELLLIGPTNTSNELTGKDDNYIRVSQPNEQETELQARFAVEEKELMELAVIADQSNQAYSKDWFQFFVNYYENMDGTIIERIDFNSEQEPDFAELAQQVTQVEAEGVLIIAGANDTAMICQQLAILEADYPLITSGWAKTPELLQRGGRSVEELYITHVFDENHPGEEYQSFKETYLERYGKEPSFAAAFGYDAMMMLKEGLLAGDTYSTTELKQTLLETEQFQGLQEDFNLDEYGDPQREYFLFQVQSGQFKRLN